MSAKHFAAWLAMAIMVLGALALAQHSCSSQSHRNQAQNEQQPRSHDPQADPLKNGSTQGGDQKTQQGTEHQEKTVQHEGNPWLDGLEAFIHFFEGRHEFWVAFGTILIGVFTGILGFATVRLFRATAALVQADRPRMLVSELKAAGIRGTADATTGQVKILLSYQLKNFGKSPASLTRFCMKIRLDTDVEPIPDYTGAVEAREIKHILPPNGWFGNTGKPHESEATPAEVADLIAKRKWIFFFGIIEYKGLGGAAHKLRFCYRVYFGDGDESVNLAPAGPDSYWEET